MLKYIAVCVLLTLVTALSASPVHVIRTIDTREPADQALTMLHGETINLRLRLLNYAQPIDLTGWSITLHGQTNNQSLSQSYQLSGTAGLPEDPAAAAQGWASLNVPVSTWWPPNAPSGRWTMLAISPDTTIRVLRAGGPLSVRGTAAADVTAEPPQIVAEALRTQWLADIAAATNAVTSLTAERLTGSNAWITIASQTGIQVRVTSRLDTNTVQITSASPDYNGLPVGTLFGRHAAPQDYDEMWTNLNAAAGGTVYRDGTEWKLGWFDGGPHSWIQTSATLPATLYRDGLYLGTGSCTIDHTTTITTNVAPLATQPDVADHIALATNTLIQTYLLGTNAWMSISNNILTIWRTTNSIPASLWSSAESASSDSSIDPSFTNAVWSALSDIQATIDTKASKAWGQYAPDGSANPDPAYMTWLNAPATMHASGFQWSTYGTYSVMAQSGAVAFESGADGEARWGLDLQTNYVGFIRGGAVIIGAQADAINVSSNLATIIYPYTSGDFPTLWFSPALNTPFTTQSGVVWVDNADGTATVTAPATTSKGFWYATTTATFDTIFQTRPPVQMIGGVFGATNTTPVIYDATITVTSGGKSYRIPAQELP